MKTRMNFKDEFYQKLKLLVLPIADPEFYAGSRQRNGCDHAGLD